MKAVSINRNHRTGHWLLKYICCGIFLLLLHGSFGSTLRAENGNNTELPLYEIITGVNKILSYPKGKLSGKMLHVSPWGKSRLITITAFISENDLLFKFKSKLRGEELKILYNLKKKDIWVYNVLGQQTFNKKNIDRFDSILLTNYYFIDLSGADFINNYKIEMKGNAFIKGYNCYELKLFPRKKDWKYGLLTMYISKHDLVPLRIDFHDANKILFKTLAVSRVIKNDNRIIPVRYDMLDIKNRTVTILEFIEFKEEAEFKSGIFSHFNLGG